MSLPLSLALFFSFWESESVYDSLLPMAVKGSGGVRDIWQKFPSSSKDMKALPPLLPPPSPTLLWLEVPPGRPAAGEMMLIDWINQDVWRKETEQVQKQRDFNKFT